MKKARTVKQKVMGRPRTGIRPLMGFRADDATRSAIMKWAENQSDKPTLSEAIRRLVELGLMVKARPKQAARTRAEKTSETAAEQLDRLMDKFAPAEEQARRKRKPLMGPEEFREVRVDRPKKK